MHGCTRFLEFYRASVGRSVAGFGFGGCRLHETERARRFATVAEVEVVRCITSRSDQTGKYFSYNFGVVFSLLSFFFGRSVGRPVGRSVGRSVVRSVGGWVGRSVGRSIERSVGRSVDRSVGKKRGENSEVVREILPGLIRPGSNTSYNFHFAYRGNTARPVRLTQTSKPS